MSPPIVIIGRGKDGKAVCQLHISATQSWLHRTAAAVRCGSASEGAAMSQVRQWFEEALAIADPVELASHVRPRVRRREHGAGWTRG